LLDLHDEVTGMERLPAELLLMISEQPELAFMDRIALSMTSHMWRAIVQPGIFRGLKVFSSLAVLDAMENIVHRHVHGITHLHLVLAPPHPSEKAELSIIWPFGYYNKVFKRIGTLVHEASNINHITLSYRFPKSYSPLNVSDLHPVLEEIASLQHWHSLSYSESIGFAGADLIYDLLWRGQSRLKEMSLKVPNPAPGDVTRFNWILSFPHELSELAHLHIDFDHPQIHLRAPCLTSLALESSRWVDKVPHVLDSWFFHRVVGASAHTLQSLTLYNLVGPRNMHVFLPFLRRIRMEVGLLTIECLISVKEASLLDTFCVASKLPITCDLLSLSLEDLAFWHSLKRIKIEFRPTQRGRSRRPPMWLRGSRERLEDICKHRNIFLEIDLESTGRYNAAPLSRIQPGTF